MAELSEWEVLAAWDWVAPMNSGRMIHHLAALDDVNATNDDWFGAGISSCGQQKVWRLPGLFERWKGSGAKRCPDCCRATGYPSGKGSPKNDDRCRPLVEAFLTSPHPDRQGGAGR